MLSVAYKRYEHILFRTEQPITDFAQDILELMVIFKSLKHGSLVECLLELVQGWDSPEGEKTKKILEAKIQNVLNNWRN